MKTITLTKEEAAVLVEGINLLEVDVLGTTFEGWLEDSMRDEKVALLERALEKIGWSV